MNITIVGMGNAGTAIAADLSRKGHRITLLKTSNAIHTEHHHTLLRTGIVRYFEKDVEEDVLLYCVTDNCSIAFCEAELVFIFIQTTYHQDVINKIFPFLQNGQILVFEPGYLSTAFILDKLSKKDLTIVEATSTPVDCRILAPGSVHVLYRNVRNPIGVFPKGRSEETLEVLNQLGYNFILKKSVIEIALHNPNLIVHTVGGILSIPRVEKTEGEYYMYREVFTPSVWRVVEALDNEKMNVLEHLGCERMSYVDACKERNSNDLTADAKNVFFEYARSSNLKAPTSVYDRFITEDVPQGLVLLESFGRYFDIPTPISTSLIEVASAALGMNLRSIGRTIELLGEEQIRHIVEDALM